MKKALLNAVFASIKNGGVKVVYWDGEEACYGNEAPVVTLIFRRPPAVFGADDPVLALGEAYMDEVLDFEGRLEDILVLLENNRETLCSNMAVSAMTKMVGSVVEKLQQKRNIQHHYDLGNDFFSLWLDKTMSYSCAYFKTPEDSLYEAQLHKIDHILRKIDLKPGDRLLDIGSGWGWLIIKAAREYGAKALGITLSEEQYRKTKERIEKLGLTDSVDVQLTNYQDLEGAGRFDKIVSVGMFEHVGKENMAKYMDKVNQLLVPGGVSLLHTITDTTEDKPANSWMKKYIFPGGYVPTLRETVWMLPDFDFHLIHVESLRMHYAMTLDRWYENFCHSLDVIAERFDRRFVRMWSLYLRGCAASFRATGLNVHQLLFTKGLNNGFPLTYEHVHH